MNMKKYIFPVSVSIIALLLISMALFWRDIVWVFWNTQQEEYSINYWNDAWDFTYTWSTTSSLTGWEVFFTGASWISSVKKYLSPKESNIKSYIEYPNFATKSNLPILQNIITSIDQSNQEFTSVSGSLDYRYDATFSLASNTTIGSILYEIHTHSATGKLIDKKFISLLLTPDLQVYSPIDFIHTGSSTESIGIIGGFLTEEYKKIYPSVSLYPEDTRTQNLIWYFENPVFVFSGSSVQFSIPKNIFSDSQSKFITLSLPYDSVKSYIALTPQKPLATGTSSRKKIPSKDWKKYVALTFDDGPHKQYTDFLLNTLKQKWVHATFFMLGENAERYPEIVKRVAENGNEIWSHSYDHPSFLKISPEKIREQLTKTDEAIMKSTGKPTTILRPPYGAYNASVAKVAEKSLILWNVDSMDWKNRNVAKNLKLTLSTVYDGSIILYHDIHKESVETIGPLIDSLRWEWYEFVTVSELYTKYHTGTLLPEQVCFSMNKCWLEY